MRFCAIRLEKSGKVGIAKVVIKTRQYLAGVKPEDGALVLELMHFADELADPGKLHIPKKVEIGKREMNMANVADRQHERKMESGKISRRLSRSAHGSDRRESRSRRKGNRRRSRRKRPKPTKVIDLVSVLQKSLEETRDKKRSARKKRPKHRSGEESGVNRMSNDEMSNDEGMTKSE